MMNYEGDGAMVIEQRERQMQGAEGDAVRRQLFQVKPSITWSKLWSMPLITSFYLLFGFATEDSLKLGCSASALLEMVSGMGHDSRDS
ncbi:hypothetical protein llap_8353 [Limosa lapponica baueri]|uniref:Uncharacterized protein n=1 Tax=Limosa lapponica baueri TaxID=1758121 RepID=A0A2I0U5K5_LIMLA|nr:hypothetical protein llap_8353 [Limosa lapponica baueri]